MKDFSHRKTFPGTTGNPFDAVLHQTAAFEKLPTVFFLALLILLAAAPSLWDWPKSALLAAFIFLDYLNFYLLPRYQKSFGPYKISVLLLALARLVLTFFPLWPGAFLNLAGSLLVFWGTWFEPHHIRLTTQTYHSTKLPLGFHLRLLHLADLHLERITTREKQLNDMIAELSPDLILFSGDFLNLSYLKDETARRELHALLADWRAPLGVYAVTGSPAVDLPEIVPDLVRETPIRLLENETAEITIEDCLFKIIGVTCSHKPHQDGPILQKLVDPSSGVFQILLYHSPDLAPLASRLGVDIQLSGHTHGGQIRLPGLGALFTGSLYGKRFEAGPYYIENMLLYISRGLGLEGLGAPRARLFCPPEIIVWEISGSQS